MPTITLSVSLGEVLFITIACILGLLLFRRCRNLRRLADSSTERGYDPLLYGRGELLSKLAVAISLILTRAEARPSDDDQSARLLAALREGCLAVIETAWLGDLERVYEDSKNRRIAAYEHSTSIAELREKFEGEDHRLRREIEAVSRRLEQMIDASGGRYVQASERLSAELERLLR